jgi:hypothetical protein
MSVRMMSWVWEHSTVQGGSALLVLLAMADWADDYGANIFPSINRIATKSRLSERQVQRQIAQLEKDGHIVREQSGWVRGNTAHWRIDIKGDNTSPIPEKVTSESQKVTSTAEKGDTDVTRSIIDPSKEEPSGGDDWADAPWLIQFLKEQHTFNGTRLPKLIDHRFWDDLSEAVDGIDLGFVRSEFAKMAIWMRDNRAPTEKGVRRFVAGWFERAANDRRRRDNNHANFKG